MSKNKFINKVLKMFSKCYRSQDWWKFPSLSVRATIWRWLSRKLILYNARVSSTKLGNWRFTRSCHSYWPLLFDRKINTPSVMTVAGGCQVIPRIQLPIFMTLYLVKVVSNSASETLELWKFVLTANQLILRTLRVLSSQYYLK